MMRFTKRRKVWMLIVISITVVFMALEGFIDFRNKIKSIDETSTLLLAEAMRIVTSNEEESKLLMESLKEDYITRARAVSYTLEHVDGIDNNINELKKLAALMNVDEIHLFDREGVICGGTVEEYYGISMKSGDQISYFLPMLSDETLAMCQDVSPNTAEGKFMMYAMVWREDKSGLVQVGIEPQRLFSELHGNQTVELVDSMLTSEGYNVYVADRNDGIIYGATNHEDIGITLDEAGLKKDGAKLGTAYTIRVRGENCRVVFETYEDYEIGIVFEGSAIYGDIIFNLLTVLICIIAFMLLIMWIVTIYDRNRDFFQEEIDKSHEDRDRQYAILKSMSEMYTSMYLLNLQENTVSEYVSTDKIRQQFIETDNIAEMMKAVMTGRSSAESRETILEFCDLNTIASRMQNIKSIYKDFINAEGKWARATFISIEVDESRRPVTLVYAVMDIDEEKRREEVLLLNSNTDGLTGCYNRRAYVDDIKAYKDNGIPDNLILVAMDINGLKTTNDTMGHAAGDELIMGAVSCIRGAMSGYGKIYRTGGDEFMAILMTDSDTMVRVAENFTELTLGWSGTLARELSVSIGYVVYSEDKPGDFGEMERLADRRMYDSKSNYYSVRGIDRRGIGSSI